MHCPRCGQQQISVEIKYCSRCGFALGLVSEILQHDGYLPQLVGLAKKGKLPSRRTGVKIGLAWFLVVTFLATPLLTLTQIDELIVASGIVGFMGGIVLMLLAWMFLEKDLEPHRYQRLAAEEAVRQSMGGRRETTALPPQSSQSVTDFMPPAAGAWKTPDTNEFTRAASSAEKTTRFTAKDK